MPESAAVTRRRKMRPPRADILDHSDPRYSPITLANYEYALRRLRSWSGGRKWGDYSLAKYIALHGGSAGAGRVISAAVAAWAMQNGKPNPVGEACRRQLAAMRRAEAGKKKPREDSAAPLLWPEVDYMAEKSIARRSAEGFRDAALFYCMSDALLRIGEAAAITFEDMHFYEEDGKELATCHIRKSKTDQHGRGHDQFLDFKTCLALRHWEWELPEAERKGFIFREYHAERGPAPADRGMNTARLRELIKQGALRAGIGKSVAGHSFRKGSAMELTRRGFAMHEIMIEGRWRTPVQVARYIRQIETRQGAMARAKGRAVHDR